MSAGDGSEPKADDDATARDEGIDDDSLASEREGGDQDRPAGTSPTLAWGAPPGEEEEGTAGGGSATDEEVERLWRRMKEIDNRIYQARADEKVMQVQVWLNTTVG